MDCIGWRRLLVGCCLAVQGKAVDRLCLGLRKPPFWDAGEARSHGSAQFVGTQKKVQHPIVKLQIWKVRDIKFGKFCPQIHSK